MRSVSALLVLLFVCAPALAQDTTPALAVDGIEVPDDTSAPSRSYVVLKDGQMVAGDIRLMPSARNAQYALYNNQRLELSDISQVSTGGEEFGVARHPHLGSPVLLRKTTSGRIDVYDEMESSYASGLQFFQKDDGAILMVNQPNLRDALSDNPASMRYLDRHSTYQKVGFGSLIVGAAALATGAALQLGGYEASGTFDSPIVIAASGVLFATSVNFVIPMFQRQASAKAVQAYNRR